MLGSGQPTAASTASTQSTLTTLKLGGPAACSCTFAQVVFSLTGRVKESSGMTRITTHCVASSGGLIEPGQRRAGGTHRR
jgi:hypothetical protein